MEYHVDGHVIDLSAMHGHVATLRSNGAKVMSYIIRRACGKISQAFPRFFYMYHRRDKN